MNRTTDCISSMSLGNRRGGKSSSMGFTGATYTRAGTMSDYLGNFTPAFSRSQVFSFSAFSRSFTFCVRDVASVFGSASTNST